MARASDVPQGRQSWKDDRGLGDVTKDDAGDDRDVEVVMGRVLQAVGGGRHG